MGGYRAGAAVTGFPMSPDRRDDFLSRLQPDARLEDVYHITPEYLRALGLRGLALDLDNTIVPYGDNRENLRLTIWVAGLSAAGVRAVLVSNAMPERVRLWSGRLGVPGLALAGKPWPWGFRRAARRMKLAPSEVAVVGDQLFTDVLGGKLAGSFTILVTPISSNSLPHTRLARYAERLLLSRSHGEV